MLALAAVANLSRRDVVRGRSVRDERLAHGCRRDRHAAILPHRLPGETSPESATDGPLELTLRHLGAALDVLPPGLLVELIPRPATRTSM